MKKTKRLSELEIGEKIKKGDDFTVATESDRKRCLTVAKCIGAEIVTYANKKGYGFTIHIPSEVPN